jgi:hypothetical protein
MFWTISFHEIQLIFRNGLPNTPTSATQLKKSEVDPNFTIFIKQQKMSFTNTHSELCHVVGEKLPTFTITYKKTIHFYSLMCPLSISFLWGGCVASGEADQEGQHVDSCPRRSSCWTRRRLRTCHLMPKLMME